MLPWSLHIIEEETEVSWLGQGMGKTTRRGAVKEARSTPGSQELEDNLKWQSFKTPNLTHSDSFQQGYTSQSSPNGHQL